MKLKQEQKEYICALINKEVDKRKNLIEEKREEMRHHIEDIRNDIRNFDKKSF